MRVLSALSLMLSLELLALFGYYSALTADPLVQGYMGAALPVVLGIICYLAGMLNHDAS